MEYYDNNNPQAINDPQLDQNYYPDNNYNLGNDINLQNNSNNFQNYQNDNNQNNQENTQNQNINQAIDYKNFYKKSSNPKVCLAYVIFRLAPFVCFLLICILTDSEPLVIIVTTILSAVDFWFTKNIAGRKLVGLRWWNYINELNQNVWRFEGRNEKNENPMDKRVFWGGIYIEFGIWIIIFFWEIIRFKFMMSSIPLICAIFSGLNVYGFLRCSKKQQQAVVKFSINAKNYFNNNKNNNKK